MNVEEALVAAVEQRPIAGVRRTARLQASALLGTEQTVLA